MSRCTVEDDTVGADAPAHHSANRQLTAEIEALPPRPAEAKGASLETIRERVAKWLPDLEIMDGFDGFSVKPKHYLGDTWAEINEAVRALGGHWQKGQTSKDGSWRIPK
jgi:hypothetical protein